MATGKRIKVFSPSGALLATMTFLDVEGQVSILFGTAAPLRLQSLLDRIRRRGLLVPDVPEVDERPPPGFHFEPATADNLGRTAEEVEGLYPEGIGMSIKTEVIG